MSLDRQTLSDLFNSCDPELPLEPGDSRNVDIDNQPIPVRGEPWIRKMARRIELSRTPQCLLFSGLRGSGKSTELRRLAAYLQDGPAELLTILINAETLIDLTSKIDISDILSMVLYETEKRLLELEDKKPEEAMQSGVFRRFWDYVTRTDIEFTKAEIGFSKDLLNAKLSTEMRTNPALREKVRKLVSNHLRTFIAEVFSEFESFNERAKKLRYQGLVVVVDSLEKIQGTSQSWKEVLESAERIFANDAPFLRLPVHVIYTFPPALTQRLNTQVSYLPMLKLHDREGRVYPPGFDAAREIIRKRIPDTVLAELFGAPFVETRLREIIDWSGGYPRELVRFLRALLTEDPFPINEARLQKLLRSESRPYHRMVLDSVSTVALTARIWVTKSLTVLSADEQPTLDRLLSANVILRYSNDEDWVDVHPAVTRLDEIKEAAEKYRASLGAPASSPANS